MNRTLLAVAAAATLMFTGSAGAQEDALVSFEVLSPDLAAELARETLMACRERDFQVAVAVVDRFGNPQAMLRDRYAGAHTPDTATRKAWTAVSFRSNTTDLVELTAPGTPQAGARDIKGALMLGGGVLIEVQGRLIGAIGVSGAPSGDDDDACAFAGLEAIEPQLPF